MLFELLNETLPLAQVVSAGSPLDAPVNRSTTAFAGFEFELLIPIVAIVLGCTVAMVAILAGVVRSSHQEKTRREIAAYVAEGAISPEDGERMIRAASTTSKC